MAKCGIKRYDELPAGVGWIDVDYLRWRLKRCNNPSNIMKILDSIPIINLFTLGDSKESTKYSILSSLEEAYEKHKYDK